MLYTALSLYALQDGSRFWGGLGGSDRDYAWIQMAYPSFETASVPLSMAIVHRLPYTVILYVALLTSALGGAVYALAGSVWMAFIGRALMGAGTQFCASSIHSYIGEMGTVMDDIRKRQGKKQLKFTLYIVLSFMLNGGLLIPYCKFYSGNI